MNHLVRQSMFGGAPTVIPATCTITSDESEFTDATPFEIQIVFDKPRTGFVIGDITKTGATLSGFTGSGASYAANVTPDLTGDIEISVAENVTVEGNSASNLVNVTDNYVIPVQLDQDSTSSSSFPNDVHVIDGNIARKLESATGDRSICGINSHDDGEFYYAEFKMLKIVGTYTFRLGVSWDSDLIASTFTNAAQVNPLQGWKYLNNAYQGTQSGLGKIDVGDILRIWVKDNKIWFGQKKGGVETVFGDPVLGTGAAMTYTPTAALRMHARMLYECDIEYNATSSTIECDALGATPFED